MRLLWLVAAICCPPVVQSDVVPAVVQAHVCSPEAARLAAIINNMTLHLDESITSSRTDHQALQSQVDESIVHVKEMLKDKQASLEAVQANIGHKRGQKSNAIVQQSILKTEQTELQQQSEELVIECKEYETVFTDQQRDSIGLLQFVDALRDAVSQKGFDAPNHQVMLQEVYKMLPVTMLTPDSSSQIAELQALLQVAQDDVKTTSTTAQLVQELLKVLAKMQSDTQENMKAGEALLKEQQADCKGRSAAFRDSAEEITDRLKTTADSIVSIDEELSRLSLESGYVQEEVELLQLSITDKSKVLSEVKAVHDAHVTELSRQAGILRGLFDKGVPSDVLCI